MNKKRKLTDVEPVSFCAQHKKLWTQRKFTDAEVVVGETRIPVHRATVSAGSPVFDAAFTHSMKEGETATYTVTNPNAGPAEVEAMLKFFYTGVARDPDTNLNCSSLLELAVEYQV